RRAAALETKVASILGVKRTKHRPRFKSAPDMEPVTLPCGAKLQPEAKKRATIPTYVRDGLAQARRYTPDAIPVCVIEQTRGEPIACLPLDAFVQLVGIAPLELPAQPTLPMGGRTDG